MTEVLTESFCERCGTKYTFEGGAEAPSPVQRARTLVRGLRYYLLSDDPLDEALAEARRDDERDSAGRQLDAFHQTFNFCIECRQYVCGECWNEQASRCLTCAPMPGRVDILGLEVDLGARLGPAATVVEAGGAVGGADVAQGGAWPAADLVATPIETVQAATPSAEAVPAEATRAETAPVETAQAAASPIETTAAEASRATGATAVEPATPADTTPVEAAPQQPAESPSIEAAAASAPPTAPTEKAAAATPPTPDVAPARETTAAAAAVIPPTAPPEDIAAPAPAATTAPATPDSAWQIVAPEEVVPAAGPTPGTAPASGPQPPEPSSQGHPRRGGGIFRRRAPTTPSRPSEAPPRTRPAVPSASRPGPSAGQSVPPATPPPARIQAQSAGEQAASGSALWEDSARGVLNHPESSVQACVSCGLPLSATARFCRRCGAKQG